MHVWSLTVSRGHELWVQYDKLFYEFNVWLRGSTLKRTINEELAAVLRFNVQIQNPILYPMYEYKSSLTINQKYVENNLEKKKIVLITSIEFSPCCVNNSENRAF